MLLSCEKLKRAAALALCAALLLPIAACGSADDGSAVTSAAATEAATEDPYLDNLPDSLKYGGDEIRFLSEIETVNIALSETDDTGDIVNEALWKRNMAIEDRLGLKITLAKTTGINAMQKETRISITAGSDDYDVLVGHCRFSIALAADGYLKNLNNVEYLDFSKKYWSSLYIDNISYKDAIYWATGDISTNFISYIFAMFGNTTLWTDFYGSTDELFALVKNGGWTLDKLEEYTKDVYGDLNGNATLDNDDRYGFSMATGHQINALFFAAGTEFTSRDDEGAIHMSLNNDHTVAVFERLHGMLSGTDNYAVYANEVYDGASLDLFVDNRLMFYNQMIGYCTNQKMRAMEGDFFIIPNPKFNEEQENYVAMQYDGIPLYGIPITVALDRVSMIGAALEAMCSMSSSMVLPVYYDDALKNKYSRDPETAEMIDLIHDSVKAEFAYSWGDSLGGVIDLFYTNITKNSISSTLASYEKRWTKLMDKLLTNLEANGEN